MTQPCAPLVTYDDVVGCGCKAADGADPVVVAEAIDAASQIAWVLSGRRYGTCAVVGERPARPNDRCCPTTPCRCGCRKASTAWLANPPVIAVSEVRLGGEVVEDWMLTAPNRLVRLYPERWPACVLADEPDGAEDVLEVDYTWGLPVDAFGTAAISAYACELTKSCLGQPCDLPERVSQVSRQGVSFVIESAMAYLDDGRTGVPALDQWLAAVNPEALARRSRVRTPDFQTTA